jgi:hypothetical protein
MEETITEPKTLRGIVGETELSDYLTILNQGQHLETIISELNNFCGGTIIQGIGGVDYKTQNEELAERASKLAQNMVTNYEESAIDTLVLTLKTLKSLPEKDRWQYLCKFSEFVKNEEGLNPNIHERILPEIADKILSVLNSKYEPQFERFEKRETLQNDKRYLRVVESLKKDLDTLMSYTQTKIEQNSRLDERGIMISYGDCFSATEKDLSGLTSEYITSLIQIKDPTKAVTKLTTEYGKPMGVSMGGLREGDTITLGVWFNGNGSGPKKVSLEHPKKLRTHEAQFYQQLIRNCDVDASLETDTGKCRRYIMQFN